MIDLRDLQRRLQAEAARALLSRDGDGGEIGFLGAGGMSGIGLQEDVAADAVQMGVGKDLSGPRGQRQRLVDARQGRGRAFADGFEFGEQSEISLRRRPRMFGVFRHALATLGEAGFMIAKSRSRPTPIRSSPGPI